MPPRALFFTFEVPQSLNAGSMQLYRALRDYPAERLRVMGAAPDPKADRLGCDYEPIPLASYRLACTRFREWTIGANAWLASYEPQLGRSARSAQAFRPEVVVTVMDKLSYYKHAWSLARRLRVPLLTITMDDPQTFERAHPRFANAYDRILRRIYGDAALSLGVSPEMCDYLATQFGKPSRVFYFGPPEGIVPRPAEASRRLCAPAQLTLGYAGSMSLGYREGILAVLPALEASQTRLFVYTKDRHLLVEHPLVHNRGFLPPEKLWPTVQAECDAVMLPYSFGEDIARVYRTHFPTKLSEYCWTGMPIVLSGPAYATGIRWGERHPLATVTCRSPAAAVLGEALVALRREDDRRVAMAGAAAETARREFDPIRIKQDFVSLLAQAAATGRT